MSKLPLPAYAASLGLLTAPRVRFLKKGQKKRGAAEYGGKETKNDATDAVQGGNKDDEENDNETDGDDDNDKIDLLADDHDDILIKKSSTISHTIESSAPLEEIKPRQATRVKTKVGDFNF